MVVLVATSLTFEATDVWILSTNIAAALSVLICVPNSAAWEFVCAAGLFAFFCSINEVFFAAALVACFTTALASLILLFLSRNVSVLFPDAADLPARANLAAVFPVGSTAVFTDVASASFTLIRVAFDRDVNALAIGFDCFAEDATLGGNEVADAVSDAFRERMFFLFDFVTTFAAVAFMAFSLNEPSNALISPGAACNFLVLASSQTPILLNQNPVSLYQTLL
ncbi:MAG TPA: hypothetical protein VJ603_02455 [Paucimonas sp.]|nr:hypothetical protein [Paucimonas sp.]